MFLGKALMEGQSRKDRLKGIGASGLEQNKKGKGGKKRLISLGNISGVL